jgi:hypothetical protein
MTTPPPIPPSTSDWDVLPVRLAALTLSAANTVFWLYSFRFLLDHADPKGDGFDMLPALPFTAIFFALTLPSGVKAVRGYDCGLGLALVLGASVLNSILFMAVASSYAPG